MKQIQMFGGGWTEEKLARIKKYLGAYTTIMSSRPFRTAYIDAFAGTGYRELRQEYQPTEFMFPEFREAEAQVFLQGSAQIALETQPRFDKYIFIEHNQDRFVELQRLREGYPTLAVDIILVNTDCNSYLQDLCLNRNWQKNRAVLFLDPFGMQVEWATIQAIASTQAIDMWLLFPLGVAVNRLLRKDGQIDESLKKKLDILFGTTEWFEKFYDLRTESTLFGKKESLEKVADWKQIERYFVERLKTEFAGVAEEPLRLYNSRNNPLYLLCFAAGNPKGARTAVKIAQDVLRK